MVRDTGKYRLQPLRFNKHSYLQFMKLIEISKIHFKKQVINDNYYYFYYYYLLLPLVF